jgi:sulfotransferase 6B1
LDRLNRNIGEMKFKNPVLSLRYRMVWWNRKAYHSLFQDKAYPVFCNSFMKSGTHLLHNVVCAIPGLRSYQRKAYCHHLGNATVLPLDYDPIKKAKVNLKQCLNGEIMYGHLGYQPLFQEVMSQGNYKHIFIYRDLRDVVVSHLFWWKKYHRDDLWPFRYFSSLQNEEDKISFLINGWPKGDRRAGFPEKVDFPSVGERFREFMPWLEKPEVLKIKYEDLIHPDEKYRVYAHILEFLGKEVSEKNLSCMEKAANPNFSKTFRNGTSGDWEKYFNQYHRDRFEKEAGELMRILGYK